MAGMSTAGYAAVAAGEDWHYVGEAGEPAFENGWTNRDPGELFTKLAFRIREAGCVDIQGWVKGGTPGMVIFTLPAGYRPNVGAYMPVVGEVSGGAATSAGVLAINNTGTVNGYRDSGTNHSSIAIAGSFFLDTPAGA